MNRIWIEVISKQNGWVVNGLRPRTFYTECIAIVHAKDIARGFWLEKGQPTGVRQRCPEGIWSFIAQYDDRSEEAENTSRARLG